MTLNNRKVKHIHYASEQKPGIAPFRRKHGCNLVLTMRKNKSVEG